MEATLGLIILGIWAVVFIGFLIFACLTAESDEITNFRHWSDKNSQERNKYGHFK